MHKNNLIQIYVCYCFLIDFTSRTHIQLRLAYGTENRLVLIVLKVH